MSWHQVASEDESKTRGSIPRSQAVEMRDVQRLQQVSVPLVPETSNLYDKMCGISCLIQCALTACSVQANSLLQAKVDMLRDNLKAARVASSEKAALESEVQQLKQQLSLSGRNSQESVKGGALQAFVSRSEAKSAGKQMRSLSEDGGSQSQLWMQLVSHSKPP